MFSMNTELRTFNFERSTSNARRLGVFDPQLRQVQIVHADLRGHELVEERAEEGLKARGSPLVCFHLFRQCIHRARDLLLLTSIVVSCQLPGMSNPRNGTAAAESGKLSAGRGQWIMDN
jgi:hypothetical protein